MNNVMSAALACLLLAVPASARSAPAGEWNELAFLVGDWDAAGGGQPGTASGGFSFHYEAGGTVLVRRSVADYPAADGRPATHHEDLMVIYRGSATAPTSAIYFDSEGHVIRYIVEVDAGATTVRFVSEAAPGEPRFRLTYKAGGADTVVGDFETAAPGQTTFSPYLHWTSRRSGARQFPSIGALEEGSSRWRRPDRRLRIHAQGNACDSSRPRASRAVRGWSSRA